MSTVSNVKLELVEHNHSKHTAKIRITYKINLNSVEENMTGLKFKETIQLWGADSWSSDDFLCQFGYCYFGKSSNNIIYRDLLYEISENILDEDGYWSDPDEVYAKVFIEPVMPTGSSARSNEIHHKF